MTKLILAKLDKLDDRLDQVDKTLVKQEGNLQEHMKRSQSNEDAILVITDKLEPIIFQSTIIKLGLKILLGILGTSAGLQLLISLLSR